MELFTINYIVYVESRNTKRWIIVVTILGALAFIWQRLLSYTLDKTSKRSALNINNVAKITRILCKLNLWTSYCIKQITCDPTHGISLMS